ncbi:hypothetical protein PRVXT_000992 [Proteinivorax tanatarense]|uniref:Secreted protein n=1 Tax=Proteinivorax tanatarense TaxID=1260629 RepID=A0AAU7VPE9_9FIRM
MKKMMLTFISIIVIIMFISSGQLLTAGGDKKDPVIEWHQYNGTNSI